MLSRNLTQAQQDLILAKKLIEDKRYWCQGKARSGDRRCASAAVADVCGGETSKRFYEAMRVLSGGRISERYGVAWVVHFNDSNDHAAVMGVFDKAIEQ